MENSNILQVLIEGNNREKDEAAREICTRNMTDQVEFIEQLLDSHDEKVREYAIIILSVFGMESSVKKIDRISKEDPSTNIRVAAIIGREYAGKMIYDHLKAEIRHFRGDKDQSDEEPQETEKRVKKKQKSDAVIALLGHVLLVFKVVWNLVLKLCSVFVKTPDSSVRKSERGSSAREPQRSSTVSETERSSSVLITKRNAVFALLVLLIALIGYTSVQIYKSSGTETSRIAHLQGSAAIGTIIKERIAGINEFKKKWLDPKSLESRYPMTLELRSMPGETYGSLFEKIYANTFPTERGMNTIGAFWRNVNFKGSSKFNDISLMDYETDGERLIFPNFAAFNILLDVEVGSISFESINSIDPELEISIKVDEVEIK